MKDFLDDIYDPAHLVTEEILADMERVIDKIFDKHNKIISKKSKKYFGQFKKQDEELFQKFEKGEINKTKLKNARVNLMMSGKKWSTFVKGISKEYEKANVEAIEYINSRLAYIYKGNYNYIGNQISKSLEE